MSTRAMRRDGRWAAVERTSGLSWGALALAAALAGCGGTAVVERPGGEGGSSSSSTSSATSGCAAGDACPGGEVCLFGANQCVPRCDGDIFNPCRKGLLCDTCATSSCPACDDCVGACVPVTPGTCDNHDDCPVGEVCIYGEGVCTVPCDVQAPSCPGPDEVCFECATSSCPGCEDCVAACRPGF